MSISNFDDQDKYIQFQYDLSEFQRWQIESRAGDVESSQVAEIFSELLTPVLEFLAAGHKCVFGERSLEQRAWVLIYALRPELLDGQSMVEAEEFVRKSRKGLMTKKSLVYQLGNFRKAFPLLHINTASRKGKLSDPVKMRLVTRKRAVSLSRTLGGHLTE